MFKLEIPEITYSLSSYDIVELWRFIISNKKFKYEFYLGYEKITNDEFLKMYLQETNCYPDYLRLYRVLKPLLNIEKLLQK